MNHKPLEEGQHSINSNSVCEDVLNHILFEVIGIIDSNDHRDAIEKFGEEMFRKAQVSLIEEVSNFAVGMRHQCHPGELFKVGTVDCFCLN